MSLILSQIIKIKYPSWNEFALTLEDFDWLSQKTLVPIIEDPDCDGKGEYIILDDGQPVITIKPNLKNKDKIWVIAHEFGHHFLHYPVPHKFSKGLKKRMDREANFFAAVALVPTFLIKERLTIFDTIDQTLGSLNEELNYPKELIQIRKDIYEAYRI